MNATLRTTLDDLGMSFTEVSKRSGIGYKTLYDLYGAKTKPTRSTLRKLVDWLNTPSVMARLSRIQEYRVSDFIGEG